MTWLSALAPWQWAVMAAVPLAIFLLYFLKLKRQPLEVPSTLLWRQAMEDMRVNSLWQKLRKNLLLLLQLLFVAALMLAALRPGWSGSMGSGKRYIFLIDHSASMSAMDVGGSRLQEAKRLAIQRIDSLQRGDVAMVVAFSDRADVKQGFTQDTRRLRSAVESIQPTQRTTQVSEALRAASGLANPGRVSFGGVNDVQVAEAMPATVILLSDGAFPAVPDIPLDYLTVDYTPVGRDDVANAAILSFSIDRNPEHPEEIEAYARIGAFGPMTDSRTISLYRDNQLLDAATVTLSPEEESGVRFGLEDVEEGILKLEIDGEDALATDNTAFAALRPVRRTNLLLVSRGNNALETALATESVAKLAQVRIESPSFLDGEEYPRLLEAGEIDLAIFDQCAPKDVPPCNTLWIGVQPPGDLWKLQQPQGPLLVLDWDREHPMMQYLELGSIRIVEGQPLVPPESATLLLQSDLGPLIAVAPRGPFQDAVVGFPLIDHQQSPPTVNTDWLIKRSFPLFLFSSVEFLGGGVSLSHARSVPPGDSIALTMNRKYPKLEIVAPDGKRIQQERGDQPSIVFSQTDQIGSYEVFAEGQAQPLERFTVNLFSPKESSLKPQRELSLGEETIPEAVGTLWGRRELWRPLLLLALALLALEWFVFNRRIWIG
jgi:hypothetical protein